MFEDILFSQSRWIHDFLHTTQPRESQKGLLASSPTCRFLENQQCWSSTLGPVKGTQKNGRINTERTHAASFSISMEYLSTLLNRTHQSTCLTISFAERGMKTLQLSCEAEETMSLTKRPRTASMVTTVSKMFHWRSSVSKMWTIYCLGQVTRHNHRGFAFEARRKCVRGVLVEQLRLWEKISWLNPWH